MCVRALESGRVFQVPPLASERGFCGELSRQREREETKHKSDMVCAVQRPRACVHCGVPTQRVVVKRRLGNMSNADRELSACGCASGTDYFWGGREGWCCRRFINACPLQSCVCVSVCLCVRMYVCGVVCA